ncbi:hypothetical protein L2W36_23340, partial [Vibrio sp. McD22-P3]|nr:hypothetical protein [Vibrio sp. McD22-P3]
WLLFFLLVYETKFTQYRPYWLNFNSDNNPARGGKTTLVFNDRNQMVLMNIFNSVNSTEAMMQFSTMYPFSNSSQGSSFTIPMRAKFQLGSSSGYGNFSFQTQVAVRYN